MYAGLYARILDEIKSLTVLGNVHMLIALFLAATGLFMLYTYGAEGVELLSREYEEGYNAFSSLEGENVDSGENGSVSELKFISNIEVIVYAMLRVLLALFVQGFSIFFLRLYKDTIRETKYYQNELTTIELKLMAVSLSRENDKVDVSSIVNALMSIDRNRPLENAQTTEQLERQKLDDEYFEKMQKQFLSTIDGVAKIVKRDNQQSS